MTDILARAEKFLKNENDSLAYAFVAEKRGVHLIEQLLAEAKAWKAKAIEERAMQKSRFCKDNLDEMRDFWMHDMDGESKKEITGMAARELEEEM